MNIDLSQNQKTKNKLEKENKVIIVLNGAPNSGKDSIADFMAENNGFIKLAFKEELIKIASEIAEIPFEIFFEMCYNRGTKDLVTSLLAVDGVYVSPRQFLIHVSENIIKPRHGKTYFGKKMYSTIKSSDDSLFVISDGGFNEELIPLYKFKGEKILVHLYRDNCSFKGDSRYHIKCSQFRTINIYNNSSIQEAVNNILKEVKFL